LCNGEQGALVDPATEALADAELRESPDYPRIAAPGASPEQAALVAKV
jgi:hypothetical protein